MTTPAVGATFGVEEEFHLLDPETGRPVAAADSLIAVDGSLFHAELRTSMIETATAVCQDLDEIRRDLIRRRLALIATAERLGVLVASSGTVPESGAGHAEIYPDRRYAWMLDEYQLLVDEHQVCACQVQVGVPDRDLAVRLMPVLQPWVSVLLAMSASSPMFCGRDTGYASYRTVIVSRWPTTGPPPVCGSAAEYEATVQALIDTGVVTDHGMMYYDVRPSARYPTLEIRVGDAIPLVDDVVLMAALSRALVVTAAAGDLDGPHAPVGRTPCWRACRSGLDGPLVHPVTSRPAPAAEVVEALLGYVRPALSERDEWSTVRELTDALLARGSSARRQRKVLAGGGDVARSLVEETRRL